MLDSFGCHRAVALKRISIKKDRACRALQRLYTLMREGEAIDLEERQRLDDEYELLTYCTRVLREGSLQELRIMLNEITERLEPPRYQKILHKIPILARLAPDAEAHQAALRLKQWFKL